jgi:hypothetical protein
MHICGKELVCYFLLPELIKRVPNDHCSCFRAIKYCRQPRYFLLSQLPSSCTLKVWVKEPMFAVFLLLKASVLDCMVLRGTFKHSSEVAIRETSDSGTKHEIGPLVASLDGETSRSKCVPLIASHHDRKRVFKVTFSGLKAPLLFISSKKSHHHVRRAVGPSIQQKRILGYLVELDEC